LERDKTLFTECWTGTYIACEKLWKAIVRPQVTSVGESRKKLTKAWNKADLKSKVSCFVFRLSQVILVASCRLWVDLESLLDWVGSDGL